MMKHGPAIVGLILMLSAGINADEPMQEDGQLNILFLVADDLTTRLGCYGDQAAITPNLDRLAREGVLFTRAYAPGSVCIPSRTSLTLGRWFREHGYQTFSVGKIQHDETYVDPEFVQLFDYLKCRNDRLGLLVNMGLDRVHVERVVYEKPETRREENWKYWSGRVSGRARDVGISVRDALRAVYHEHETGYGAEVTEKLILFVLQTYRLKVTLRPVATAYYHGIELHHSPLECLVIEDVPLESSLAADYQQQLDDRAATLDETAIGDRVFPHFIAKHLPPGLTGLLIAAVFAAAMSTVSTSLNSSATLLMTDDYRRFFNPQASERQCLLALYASTIVWGALGDGMDKLLPRLHGPRRRHARDSPGWRAHQSLSSWQPAPTEGGLARCLTKSPN